MIAWMFLHQMGFPSAAFPEKPITDAVTAGRNVYRRGQGIDRTLLADRVTLGTWFDGRVRRPVDTVTWVRPEVAARWFGYLAERDAWTNEVVQRRWSAARRELDGRMTFVAQLAAFPRLDPFEFGIGAPPKPES